MKWIRSKFQGRSQSRDYTQAESLNFGNQNTSLNNLTNSNPHFRGQAFNNQKSAQNFQKGYEMKEYSQG